MISRKAVRNLFEAITSPSQQRRGQSSRRKGSRRLSFTEPLEVRALLATFTVSNLNDAGAGSLREAINQANSSGGADTINFSNGLNGTISLTSGTLFIRDSLTINGPGANQLAISGGSSNFEVFQADNLNASTLSDVTINGVTIRDGGNGTTFMNGAGIFSRENLTLTNVALLNNNASSTGGGGAVQMFAGNLKMQNCTVAGNRARQGGGIELSTDAVSGLIVNTTISGNQATQFGGGIIVLSGNVVLRNCTVTGNRSNSDGSGNEIGGGMLGAVVNNVELITLHNTIVAGNLRGTGTTPDDIGNPVTPASSNNLIGHRNTAGQLQHNVNGNLLGNNGTGIRAVATILNTTLASNGGPTQTHALAEDSVAINAGSNAQAIGIDGDPLTTDQRGDFRILDTVDIGAVELISVSGPIVVDTSEDENDGNLSTGDLSLREAIALANRVSGANTITFAETTDGQPINLTSLTSLAQMSITESLTITGNGAVNTIVDGQQRGFGILDITAGDVTLNRLTLRNGLNSLNGGAIQSESTGTLTISQSTLSGNSGSGRGGAISTISGAVTISQSTLSGNSSSGGGAIYTISGAVTISQSTLSGNASSGNSTSGNSYGGAIATSSGAVTISQSTLSGNASNSTGNSFGGAIATSSGAVTISQSTLSGNASNSNSNSGNSYGGAIFTSSGAVTISQSTLSGNASNGISGFGLGGAIYTISGAVTISQSTLSGNASNGSNSSGGAISGFLANITIRNSIVAGNTASVSPNFSLGPAGSVIATNSLIGRSDGTRLSPTSGTTPDANGNFIGGTTDEEKIDPKLGPLADNGGPTQTHELLTGSLAVNRGSNSFAVDVTNNNAPLTSDQRGTGFSRILFGTVDMGAVEFSETDPLAGTNGNDAFVVTYPSASTGFVTVTVSTDGGPATSLGSFPTALALTLNGLAGTDSVRVVGTTGNDTMTVASNGLTINNSRLTLSNIENRTLAAGAGNDIYRFDADTPLGAYTLDESGGGIDTIDFSLTTTVGVSLNLGNAALQTVHSSNLQLHLLSRVTFENATGGSGADRLTGNTLDNILTGNPGSDILDGAVGDDTLEGGSGDDRYEFSSIVSTGPAEADMLVEGTAGGTDTISFAAITTPVTFSLGTGAVQPVHTNRTIVLNSTIQFENVEGGSGADRLTGNSADNVLKGNAGADILNGAVGNDTLEGGSGDDRYEFSSIVSTGPAEADRLSEGTAGGTDTISFAAITTPVTFSLGTGAVQPVHTNRTIVLNSTIQFENVEGGSGADRLTGNSVNNVLKGNAGNDTLNGAAGSDTLEGGSNDDTYIFETASDGAEADRVTELANGGIDTLDFSGITTAVNLGLHLTRFQDVHINRRFSLNAVDTFEHAMGGSDNDSLTGNALNNRLIGNNGNDSLTGGLGDDSLTGGFGDDTYIFETASGRAESDIVSEGQGSGGGIDTLNFARITTPVTLGLGLTRTQNVHTNRTLTLGGANTVERAIGGSGNDTLTGNALANTLTGNNGNDVLTGGLGSDTLEGGLGDDSYIFEMAILELETDRVTELANGGTDTLNFSAITTTTPVTIRLGVTAIQDVHTNRKLALNNSGIFENVFGGSGSDLLIGNSLANRLEGRSGNDRLVGGFGNDTLLGGLGDDEYSFDPLSGAVQESDSVIEEPNQGVDTISFANVTVDVSLSLATSGLRSVHAGRTLSLNSGSTFENAIGGSGNDTFTGNTLSNVLVGRGGADVLRGGAGRDILIGGSEADRLFGDEDDDILISGRTTNDSNSTNLNVLRGLWNSTLSYLDRISSMRSPGSTSPTLLKQETTVFESDVARDDLTGGEGFDWFFAQPDLLSVLGDRLLDRATSSEAVNAL